MKRGDIVRVTSPSFSDVAVEGEVLTIEEVDTEPYTAAKHVTIREFWNYSMTYSTSHFKIEVVRAAPVPEPQEFGHVHTDSKGTKWVRFTTDPNEIVCWMSEYAQRTSWRGIERWAGDEQ